MYLKQAFKGKNSVVHYIISTLIIILSTQIIGVIPLLSVALSKGISLNEIINNSSPKISQNLSLILQLFPFVIGCFALWICVRFIHRKRFKDVLTSRYSFDFKRFITGGIIWGVLLLLMIIPEIFSSNSTLVLNYNPQQFYWLVLICILVLPFQTSLEELLFRGYYMQATAVSAKNRWLPLIVTSIIFGLLHSTNPEVAKFGFWVAMPNYIITGFILGIAAIMDDGLELPLGMHFANNFLGAILMTSKDSALQTPALFVDSNPTMTSTDTLVSLFSGVIFLFICSKIYKWDSMKKIFSKITIEQQS